MLLNCCWISGKGTVHDIPASSWESYIPVADHPEYPSITAGVCAAFAEVVRQFFKTDETGTRPFKFTAKDSVQEPGVTPSHDFDMNWETWSEFESACGFSRLWGGLHFTDAVEEGSRIGHEIGKLAAEFIRKHINPTDTEQAHPAITAHDARESRGQWRAPFFDTNMDRTTYKKFPILYIVPNPYLG